jgi:hypothetical protein
VLSDAELRATGVASRALKDLIAESIDMLIRDLIDGAIGLWQSSGWHSYSEAEVDCTMQLFRRCQQVATSDPKFEILDVVLEWSSPSRQVLLGLTSAAQSRRPDLRFQVGRTGRSCECKRLSSTGNWAANYVVKGMHRFVDSSYGRDEPIGYVVAYVQSGEFAPLIAKINEKICTNADMGASHQLVRRDHEVGPRTWSDSLHARPTGKPIELRHVHIKVH